MTATEGLALAAVLLGTACGREPLERFDHDLVVRVTDDRGTPLAAVPIALDDRDLGETDAAGEIHVALAAPDGQRVRLDATCPPGHDVAESAEELVLRRLQDTGDGAAARLDVTIACPRSERLAALIVRAEGPGGLPVRINGVTRARTDSSGVAHIILRGAPGTSFEAEIDTGSHPRLKPQNPALVFTVAADDRLVVFDQALSARRARSRRRREPQPEPPPRPVRIR